MAILKKRFQFTGTNCNEYELNIWERENDEIDADIEKYYVSIEEAENMDEIDFSSISDVKKTIRELQNAIDFIARIGEENE